MRTLLAVFALLAAPTAASAQTPAISSAEAPAARAADTTDPRALVAATYDVISGPPGPRDWGRFRSLFVPAARMTVPSVAADGVVTLRTLSVDDYVARNGPALLKMGFAEHGVREQVDAWAHTAVVRSVYESRHLPTDAQPFARGINTFVLVNDGRRWWIASLTWEAESPSAPIGPDALRSAP